MIVQFPVKTGNGDIEIAECAFATRRDLSRIADWPTQVKARRNLAIRDSLEYASLASKRWSFYYRQGLAVSSMGALKRRIAANADIELALLVIARAKWAFPSILGLAMARRTWCGNLFLDFIATHPFRIAEGSHRVSGIGKGLLYALSQAALEIDAEALWGEATKFSAPIYEHIFGLQKVDDLLYVDRSKLSIFWEDMRGAIGRAGLH